MTGVQTCALPIWWCGWTTVCFDTCNFMMRLSCCLSTKLSLMSVCSLAIWLQHNHERVIFSSFLQTNFNRCTCHTFPYYPPVRDSTYRAHRQNSLGICSLRLIFWGIFGKKLLETTLFLRQLIHIVMFWKAGRCWKLNRRKQSSSPTRWVKIINY